jgi:hypothetical protein
MGSNQRRGQAGGSIGQQHWRPVDRSEDVIACGHLARPGHPAQPTDLHTGPHNRCTHGTPAPRGLVPCKGDNACPYRVPNYGTGANQLCPEHAREARLTVDDIRAEAAVAFGLSTDDIGRLEFGRPVTVTR